MAVLANRLEVHFAACAAAAGAGMFGAVQTSEAQIVYSGLVNVPIPNTFQGIYLNVATATAMGAPFAGWDLNPYYNAGALNFYASPSGGAAGGPNQVLLVGSGVFDGPASNLAPGTLISAASTFNLGTPFSAATGVNFPVGGDGILGFRFFNEGDVTNHYAWARIHNNAAGGGGVLVDYAWESGSGGILAGAVPAPGSLALLALGAAGLAGRRRK